MTTGTGAAQAAPTSIVDAKLISLDRKVDDADQRADAANGEGVRARWEFGRVLLAERVGKQLPKGRLDEVAAMTGKSRAELKHRVLFAERFPTEGEVDNAVIHFKTWHAIVNTAIPAAAPTPRRRSKPKGGSLISGRRGLSHNPVVVAWVRDRLADGWDRDQIVAASKANTDDWPLAKKSLSNGTVSEVRAVIAAQEAADTPPPAPPKQAGRRLRALHAQKRAGDDSDLNEASRRLMQAVGVVEGMNLIEYGIGNADQDTIERIHEELTILATWLDGSLAVVGAHMDDLHIRERIRKLREDTNGRTPAEIETAQRLADRLERKLQRTLTP